MPDSKTTELKLQTTPTGGLAGEHSPYYRRLLSAGYKGFLQGTLGGAGLYGMFGLAIGALVAIPVALSGFGGLGMAALWLIPAAGGAGVMKGASTFGNIGTVAAINAESADLAEQRRYLLDRYYELPNTADGNAQAQVIEDLLAKQYSSGKKHPLFHWKTVGVCALIGGLFALTMCTPLGAAVFAETPVMHLLTEFVAHTGLTSIFGVSGALATVGGVLGVSLGAAIGAVIGVDRYYVRKWFDGSERLLHDDSHSWNAVHERAMIVERLQNAAKVDEQTRLILERQKNLRENPDYPSPYASQSNAIETDAPAPPRRPPIMLDAPSNKVSSVTLDNRLATIQKAMEIPAV